MPVNGRSPPGANGHSPPGVNGRSPPGIVIPALNASLWDATFALPTDISPGTYWVAMRNEFQVRVRVRVRARVRVRVRVREM